MKHCTLLMLAVSTFIAGTAYSQTTGKHPRIVQIEKRLQHQHQRIDNGVKAGTIKPAQASEDKKRLDAIAADLKKYEDKNGGHLPTEAQKALNDALDVNGQTITKQIGKDVKAPTAAAPAKGK